jgi:hypothetical protein
MFHVLTIDGELQSPLDERYRVILQPCGHVIGELLSLWQAECILEAINECNPRGKRRAEIVSYAPSFAEAAGGVR